MINDKSMKRIIFRHELSDISQGRLVKREMVNIFRSLPPS